jgi:hypothetical protein
MECPCHHQSLEREIARLAQRMVGKRNAPVRAIRVRWDLATARFIATLEAVGQVPRAAAWAEDEIKPVGPAREQVVRARLAELVRGPAANEPGACPPS